MERLVRLAIEETRRGELTRGRSRSSGGNRSRDLASRKRVIEMSGPHAIGV